MTTATEIENEIIKLIKEAQLENIIKKGVIEEIKTLMEIIDLYAVTSNLIFLDNKIKKSIFFNKNHYILRSLNNKLSKLISI